MYFCYAIEILMPYILLLIQIAEAQFNLKRFEPIQVLESTANVLQTTIEARTKMQCCTRCSMDANCGATKWDSDKLECVMYKKDGLCVNEDISKSLNVLVEDTSICSLLCQGVQEPAAFDTTFHTQPQLSKLGNDVEGRYLATVLHGNKSIHIKTANGAWMGNFYLPLFNSLYPENHLIMFQRYAGYGSTVHYNGNEQSSLPGDGGKIMFSNKKNKWCKIDIV